MLSDEVNSATASLVSGAAFVSEGQDQEKDISLYINSPGGSITDGFAIYDTMNYIKCDVSTIAWAWLHPWGLSAGGRRKGVWRCPNSEMIHQPLIGGQVRTHWPGHDIKIHADHLVRIRSRLNHILAERTGKPLSQIELDTERDNYMSAQEALDYGLIDAVVEKR